MSCIFCDSWTHLPQNCSAYVSDDLRIKILRSKNRCDYCLSALDDNYHSTGDCYPQRKCYICFSRSHHTLYCPDRFTCQPFFKPNINNDLMPRFLQTLNLSDQYKTVMANPNVAVLLKPLKVITSLTINDDYLKESFDSPVVVTDQLRLMNVYDHDNLLAYVTKSMMLTAKNVSIRNLTIPLQILSLFISSKTRKLHCNNVDFTTTVTFEKILNELSDIEEMNFQHSNMDFGISWPQVLLQSENVTRLKMLTFTLKELDFCAKTLAEFMKKHNNIFIVLYCDNVNKKLLHEKISEYFTMPQGANHKGSMLKTTSTSRLQFPSYLKFYIPITNHITN